VKRFKIYKNNKPFCLLDLTDEMGEQMFELPLLENEDNNTYHTFKFEIVEVYKGSKYSDVAISEIQNKGCCMTGDTQILNGVNQTNIATIAKGRNILGMDVQSGATTATEILTIAKQTHLTMIRISTDSQQIEVTPDHPLFLKAYGFISISRYLKTKGLADYQELVNTTEVLTLNTQTGKPEYKLISSIEVLHGIFETYSILKVSKGNTYVANGFVTCTY
jgi:hypothetical protein